VSATAWGVLVIGVASFGVLGVLLVGLIRQLKRLGGSLRSFQQGVQPLADRIVREGERAQGRMQELSTASEQLRRAAAKGGRR
jgi:hypothetical protein